MNEYEEHMELASRPLRAIRRRQTVPGCLSLLQIDIKCAGGHTVHVGNRGLSARAIIRQMCVHAQCACICIHGSRLDTLNSSPVNYSS